MDFHTNLTSQSTNSSFNLPSPPKSPEISPLPSPPTSRRSHSFSSQSSCKVSPILSRNVSQSTICSVLQLPTPPPSTPPPRLPTPPTTEVTTPVVQRHYNLNPFYYISSNRNQRGQSRGRSFAGRSVRNWRTRRENFNRLNSSGSIEEGNAGIEDAPSETKVKIWCIVGIVVIVIIAFGTLGANSS